MKSTSTIAQLTARLDALSTEVADLKSASEIQFKRIADMQGELDVWPSAQERRQHPRPTTTPVPASNGNGHRP